MYEQAKIYAPAKVNLSLDIIGRREDGYHLVEMVMQTVDLFDRVTLTRRKRGGITIYSTNVNVLCDESNTASRAAQAFFSRIGEMPAGLEIALEKAIPIQAGLAGGSADAAAVLEGLNLMYDKPLSDRVLREIGLSIGADVPFCHHGGTALATGIGEELQLLPHLPDCYIVIAKPEIGISTAAAYAHFDRKGARYHPDTAAMVQAIGAGDLSAVGQQMRNVLEEVAAVEEITYLRRIFAQQGALGSAMTGSGSAVIGLFDSKRAARRCYRHLMHAAHSIFITRPTHEGVMVLELL